jgi:hypothetical protein
MGSSLVIFNVDQRRYAVPLSSVERILPAERVRSLPCASRKVCGLVNLPSQSIPVLSLRRHLGLRERKIVPSDRLLVVRCRGRAVALVAEEIEEDLRIPATGGGLDLIADVDSLLDSEEEGQLDKALRRWNRRAGAFRRRAQPRGRVSASTSGVSAQLSGNSMPRASTTKANVSAV